ncbi:MAG: FAD-dependent oxidoreductase [Acidobacteria bacterium]|nr:FAD-dependent oxidoreductase [Acidobacteriota bacterium]
MGRPLHLAARQGINEDDRCGWVETLPPRRRPVRSLHGEREVDCAVIGAGFTGLAAARQLCRRRPDWKVAVLDARQVADGSSGRSSGFLVDFTDLTAAMPWEDRLRHMRLARAGIAQLESLVKEHDIDCAWDRTGWIRAAAGPAGEEALDRWPELCEKLGLAFRVLDRQGMTGVTGSAYYRKGIRMTGYPLVQGAALVRGLAESLPEGVELFENSPVLAVEGSGPYRLTLREGSVEAARLFLATNAYSASLGLFPRQIFPVQTFGSLTRVLTSQEQKALGGEREWGVLGTDFMGSSLRRTRDQRLLVRNTLAYDRRLQVPKGRLASAREAHRRALLRRFPQLSEVELETTWSGLTATAVDYQPTFTQLHDHAYLAAGYSGAGIAMGTTLGALLADLALGESSDLLRDALALPAPRKLPPEPFRSLGARWVLARMNARARPFL